MALKFETISLNVQGANLKIATIYTQNLHAKTPIFFLHGFGSCKEDLADIVLHRDFENYSFFAYDAPGCGDSRTDDISFTGIPFQIATAEAVLNHFNITKFHLIGHSMGGLTALLLAQRHPKRVLSFVDIKGNLAPEDCFLSRQIFDFPAEDPVVFFDDFINRTRSAMSFGNPLYASTLRARVRAGAVRPIFESMVQISDKEDLLSTILGLPFPKMFMFGDENSGLSYLKRLEKGGVELAQIAESGHFPMYSNPVLMYRRIFGFLQQINQSIRCNGSIGTDFS